jgi:hypothetical protein
MESSQKTCSSQKSVKTADGHNEDVQSIPTVNQTVINQSHNSHLNGTVIHSPLRLAHLPAIDIPELSSIVVGFEKKFSTN